MPARPSAREVLTLFRDILRVHRATMPPPMRALGDRYVKAEFQAHHRDGRANDAQLAQFVEQWRGYLDMLRGTADLPGGGGGIPDSVLADLSPEQAARLAELEKEARAARRAMLPPERQ